MMNGRNSHKILEDDASWIRCKMSSLRLEMYGMASGGAISTNLVRFGGEFELDLRSYELRRSGQPLKLEHIPMELLLLLIEQRGQLVSRDQIVERVWGKDVFLDTDNSINAAVRKIRQVLKDDSEQPRFVQTLTGRGYRFIAPVEEVGPSPAPIEEAPPAGSLIGKKIRFWAAGATIVAAVTISGSIYLSGRHAGRLTAEDTIVLGDFANSTSDPIFDDTLKEALTVTLRQSPFLNILPEAKIAKTLKLMTREPTTALTPALASEVCQRSDSKAYVAGSIGRLDTAYVVGLKAVNCHNGETLAQEQLTAGSKEQVLVSLGEAATKLRRELGESLTTVQKFDVPLIEATTPSLEALRELSLGQRAWNTKGESEALPYMKRAVELDPKFASAYANLGTVYQNLQQHGMAADNFTKAYELRERVSERERFHILGHYYGSVTGELEKAIPIYEQWEREYPTDATPRTNVGNIYLYLGQNENSLAEHQDALRVESNGVLIYENLALSYWSLNRFDEAVATVNQAFARHLDDAGLHTMLQQIAFLRDDVPAVQQQLQWGMGKPGIEDQFMSIQADIEAAEGHIRKSREFTRRATGSAARSGSKETAAFWQALGALHEADLDNPIEAARQADAALALTRNRDTLVLAALAFARAGKGDRARTIADQLDHEFPLDTLVQSYWLPTIRAAIQLGHRDAAGALQALQPAVPYELGSPQPIPTLYPVYLRGRALLLSHQGAAAAVEFEKVLGHRALATFAVGSLANLDLGRAYAMCGENKKAARAYEDFFSLWKDADPDAPIIREAKVEFARLKPASQTP